MSGSSSVVSLLPRGAVPYCSTWCSLCCLAAQPRRLQLLVTGSASSPLRRPSPPVFVSWRRLSMVSNALLFFYILFSSFCAPLALRLRMRRSDLVAALFFTPTRTRGAPRAHGLLHISRSAGQIPDHPPQFQGIRGFAFGDTAPWFYLGAVPPPSLC